MPFTPGHSRALVFKVWDNGKSLRKCEKRVSEQQGHSTRLPFDAMASPPSPCQCCVYGKGSDVYAVSMVRGVISTLWLFEGKSLKEIQKIVVSI